MRNELFIKAYRAEEIIPARTIVKFGTQDATAKIATAVTDGFIGVTGSVGATAVGDTVDVVKAGVVEVIYGGTVTRGDLITTNATGQAVKSSANGDKIIGIAETSGVQNDIGSVYLSFMINVVGG